MSIEYSPEGISRLEPRALLGQYRELILSARLGKESDVLWRTEHEILRRINR